MSEGGKTSVSGMRRWLLGGGALTLVLALVAAWLWGGMILRSFRADDPLLNGWRPYEAAAFEAAVAEGGPVIVEVYAPWCPTCIAQHKAFEEVWSRESWPGLTAFRADFDADKPFRDANGIRSTGLLLLYRDGREVLRRPGVTTPEAVKAFLDEAAG